MESRHEFADVRVGRWRQVGIFRLKRERERFRHADEYVLEDVAGIGKSADGSRAQKFMV